MDITALALSLKLAFWTCVILLPMAVFIGRLLAWRDFAGKALVEAAIALPLWTYWRCEDKQALRRLV